MRLLPPHKDVGWTPYVWLIYLGFFFIHPVIDHVGWGTWLATALGTAVFLVLYFQDTGSRTGDACGSPLRLR